MIKIKSIKIILQISSLTSNCLLLKKIPFDFYIDFLNGNAFTQINCMELYCGRFHLQLLDFVVVKKRFSFTFLF